MHAVIDELSDEAAEDLLDYLNMRADPDVLSGEELAEVEDGLREIARGDFVTLAELKRELGRDV